jgi:type I restriction enzyme S subunit
MTIVARFLPANVNLLSVLQLTTIITYLDSVQARLVSLRELQSATGEELDALLPSVLDRAFKGEL